MSKAELKTYRAEIRAAWLPLTGKKRLSGNDDRWIAARFEAGVPIALILRAIEEVKSHAVYALGYITGRVERLKREAEKVAVGASEDIRQKAEGGADDQHEEWRLLIEEMHETERNPERAAIIKELLGVLDQLGLEEIQRRIKEI